MQFQVLNFTKSSLESVGFIDFKGKFTVEQIEEELRKHGKNAKDCAEDAGKHSRKGKIQTGCG